MPKNENPFIGLDHLRFAPGDPANDEMMLSQVQQLALPALMWFFDASRFRAQGRTYLLAYVAIQLAMQGGEIELDDLHTALMREEHPRRRGQLAQVVSRIIDKHFKGHVFHIRSFDGSHVLTYRGRKPS